MAKPLGARVAEERLRAERAEAEVRALTARLDAPDLTALPTAEQVGDWLVANRWSTRLMLVGGGCVWPPRDVLAAVAALVREDTDHAG